MSLSSEEHLQAHVATMLRAYLPDGIWWSASLSGIRLTPHLQKKAKGQGLNRGAPDLSFVMPSGVTRYIELKVGKNGLTDEQEALQATLGGRMAVCRSWPEVRDQLAAWMAPHGLRFLTDTESFKRANPQTSKGIAA